MPGDKNLQDINHDVSVLLEEASREAGEIALTFFEKNPQVWMKGGTSPVSEADLAVDKFLKDKLQNAFPEFGWLSEETEDTPERLSKDFIFIVDPIDGTRGFIAGTNDWTISLAAVSKIPEGNGACRPFAAALYNPCRDELFSAQINKGSFLNGTPLQHHSTPSEIANTKISISHNKPFARSLEEMGADLQPFISSLAYRIALVANNKVDAMISRPNAHDWDIAAVDLILSEAGGCLKDLSVDQIEYNRKDSTHGQLIASNFDLCETIAAQLLLE